MAAGLAREAIHLAQAQAGATAHVLGGEERFEGALQRGLIHAVAGVAHCDEHVLAGLHGLGDQRDIILFQARVARFDGQAPAGGHRVTCVDREIDQCIFQFRGVRQGRPEAGAGDGLQRNRLAERALQEIGQPGDEAVGIDRLGPQRLATGEGEQA